MMNRFARKSLGRLHAAGFAVSCISFILGGAVEVEAWRGSQFSSRPANSTTWTGSGRDLSEAIAKLEESIEEGELL